MRVRLAQHGRFIGPQGLRELESQLCTTVDVKVGQKDKRAVFSISAHESREQDVSFVSAGCHNAVEFVDSLQINMRKLL